MNSRTHLSTFSSQPASRPNLRLGLLLCIPFLALALVVPGAQGGAPTCNPPSGQGDNSRVTPTPAPNRQISSKKPATVFTANDWNSPLTPQRAGVVVHAAGSSNVSALVNPAAVDQNF